MTTIKSRTPSEIITEIKQTAEGKVFINGGELHEYYCKTGHPVWPQDEECKNCGAVKPWFYHYEVYPEDVVRAVLTEGRGINQVKRDKRPPRN